MRLRGVLPRKLYSVAFRRELFNNEHSGEMVVQAESGELPDARSLHKTAPGPSTRARVHAPIAQDDRRIGLLLGPFADLVPI